MNMSQGQKNPSEMLKALTSFLAALKGAVLVVIELVKLLK
jgi:hypothetical protein